MTSESYMRIARLLRHMERIYAVPESEVRDCPKCEHLQTCWKRVCLLDPEIPNSMMPEFRYPGYEEEPKEAEDERRALSWLFRDVCPFVERS